LDDPSALLEFRAPPGASIATPIKMLVMVFVAERVSLRVDLDPSKYSSNTSFPCRATRMLPIFLKSFDLLPELEKREVASEIIRRTLALHRKIECDEAQLASLYAEFAEEDRALAEEGNALDMSKPPWSENEIHPPSNSASM